jgi:16S rRNA (guanine527-N7)-methyltransferase
MTDESWPFTRLLKEGLYELSLLDPAEKSDAGIFALLRRYIEEIELFNEAYGLVKVNDRSELIVKHILDSLAPLGIITQLLGDRSGLVKIADVGSGAGLPGLPLAICLPHAEFTLIERMGRRAGFLRNCIAVLGIGNVQVEEKEMEKAAAEGFDLVVFRAFRPLEPAILKALLRLLKPGGFLAAWKGRLENSRDEMLAVEKSFSGLANGKAVEWEIQPLTVPFLKEERHLTVIKPGSS